MLPAALGHELHTLLNTVDPAHLGPQARASALPLNQLERRLGEVLNESGLTSSVQQLIRSLFYLWHDHLNESHQIAQEIESADSSLLHGIMHRREPDFANAKYWFRRVGAHPSYLALSLRVGELLDRHSDTDLHSRLVPNKMWDPFAFVDAVEDADTGKFSSKVAVLEQIQKLEFECLLENLLHRVSSTPGDERP